MKSLIVLLFVTTSVLAQAPIDSLYEELAKVKSPEDRVDILNILSHTYTQLSLDHAEKFANQALNLALSLGYQKGIASSYNNLGISSSIRGEYTAGMDYFIKALQIREEQNDYAGISHIYNNMSRVFTYQEDYERALEYSKKSLEMLSKLDDPKATGSSYISLGAIYMNKKDFDQAYSMFIRAREIFIEAGLQGYLSWSQIKIATALLAQNKNQQALEVCLAIMKTHNVSTDLFSMIELYLTMGIIYSNMGEQLQAAHHLHLAMALADKSNDSNGRIESRLKMSEMFRKFKEYDSAWYYNDQYIALRSEILNTERSRQLAALEQLYQSEKKDQLLEMREQKIKSQSIIIAIISALLIVISAMVFVILKYYRNKKKSIAELERLNKEISDKHEEIRVQSEELTHANEEIKRINETLEAEVALRVDEVRKQNEKLIEYAYFNAHKVRGPLARILGLSMLMSREQTFEGIQEYNIRLNTSAQELDTVIREINLKLSD